MPMDPSGTTEQPPATPRSVRGEGTRLRRRLLVAGAVGLPALAFVLWWFQPQALLFDDVVDESFPIGADPGQADDDGADGDASVDEPIASDEPEAVGTDPDDTDPDDTDPSSVDPEDDATGDEPTSTAVGSAPTGPVEVTTGSFISRNRYTVTGTATTYRLEDGERILRLEDFESTNGPDLFVYLTAAGSADDDDALDADFVDLGTLTGNIGSQNYVIPDDVDLDRYTSVVIWCRRFTTSFGVADLSNG